MKKVINGLLNNNKIGLVFVAVNFVLGCVLSFWLANKRYVNFEFGKFDLGNMSQLVWNTSRGRIFELTDQFGSNVSRLAMSHFDPILLVLAPIFWFTDNPMALVLVQHIVLWSAVFPIYLLAYKKTKSVIISISLVIIYSLQPALGYLLVWTEIHGITLVAGVFIWLIWYLEKFDYDILNSRKKLLFYILLIVIILAGKEEIGAILAIFSVFLFLKNKRLGILTFVISTIWFFTSFFILIPSYSHVRDESIGNFLSAINFENPKPEDAAGDNFFYLRYSYLGSTYPEMLKNLVFKPYLLNEVINTEANGLTLLNLFGPFGFIVAILPLWLISLPDYLITLLSIDPLFSITNHRLSFVFISLFVSFIYFVSYIYNKGGRYKIIAYTYVFVCMMLSVYFTLSSNNPLFTPIRSRISINVPSTYAKEEKKFEIGKVYKSEKPENSFDCLKLVSDEILRINPRHYTGPDYLGAYTSHREVNALFPTALKGADMFVADFYEDKAYEPLDAVETWTVNKDILSRTLKLGEYQHKLSCGRMILFTKGELKDQSEIVPSAGVEYMDLSYKKNIGVNIKITESPSIENGKIVKYLLNRQPEINLNDKVFYWRFYDRLKDKDYYFIDYAPLGLNDDLSGVERVSALSIRRDMSFISDILNTSEEFDVFYGISNQINSVSIYLGAWKF